MITQQLKEIVEQAAAEAGSVNQLCKAAGVPQSSVSAWLAGSQANLSWPIISRLCDHLGAELVSIHDR